MITESRVRKDYEYLKKRAGQYCAAGKYSKAIDCIQTACTLAKTYYLSYADQELESLCEQIANQIIAPAPVKKAADEPKTERWVFYDYFALDSITLTQQYMRALCSWNVEVLFVISHDLNGPKSCTLKKEIEQHPQVSVCTVSRGGDPTKYVQKLVECVREFSPTKAFVHTATDDVAGIVAWYALPEVTKYFTELIDHTFWIGANCCDFYISFRDYGYNVAKKYRGIPEEKILIQPYYPIYDRKPFQGIDGFSKDTVNLFSGGRMVKIYSKEDEFFHVVRRILEENPNAVFYYAGGGYMGENSQTTHMNSLIKKHNLEDRFVLIGFRSDIIATLENMDMYIGTYPMCGGLMTQMAACCGLPILQYAKNGMGVSADDFLLNKPDRPSIVYHNDPDGFFARAKELIEDKEKRVAVGEALRKCVISPDEFNRQLCALVRTNVNAVEPSDFDIDISIWRANRFETENSCEHSYYMIYTQSACFRSNKPLMYAINAARFIAHSDKQWLIGKIKKRLARKA